MKLRLSYRLRISVALLLLTAILIGLSADSPQRAEAQGGQQLEWGVAALGQVTGPEGALFSFQGFAGEVAKIEIVGIGGFIPTVAVQDFNRNTLAQDGNPNRVSQLTFSYTVFSDGVHYILVNGVDNGVGQFTILLSRGLPPGIPLTVDVPIEGIITNDFPAIFYDFMTSATENTILNVRSATQGYSPSVTVYTLSGEVIASVNSKRLLSVTLEFAPGEVETLQAMVEIGEFLGQANMVTYYSHVTPEEGGPSPDSTPEVTDGTVCTITPGGGRGEINVRSGGSTNHPVVGVLRAGQSAVATGYNSANDGWYEIRLSNGVVGWIASFVVDATGNCASLPIKNFPPASSISITNTPGPSPTGPLSATPTPSPTSPDSTQTVTDPPTATATYTVEAPPTAAPDANFNNPLDIPLDGSAFVSDYVSYPNGDREDRVRYSVTGMNPTSSLPGGRADLVIVATCSGSGTEHIEFFTGGQTYHCGDIVVNREVTFDSNTGQITITAVNGSGTYVQWTLTGNATRK